MKPLKIEWKHLDKDGQTCERCANTGETICQVVEELKSDLLAKGWEITFKETLLTEKQIDQSNEVLINNIALEKILPFAEKSENCCASCEDLLGLPTLCRTIEFQGKTYEAIPAELIKKAIWQVIEKA